MSLELKVFLFCAAYVLVMCVLPLIVRARRSGGAAPYYRGKRRA